MDFLLRQAIVRDFNKLIEFYRKEHSDALPAPSARAIGDAIERDQLLLLKGTARSWRQPEPFICLRSMPSIRSRNSRGRE
jgi:hypothetical protein